MVKSETQKITLTAILSAFAATLKILSDLLSNFIPNATRLLSMFQIPLLLSGYYCGPVYGLLSGFIADIVYAATPGTKGDFGLGLFFSITTMMWGLTGHFLSKRKIKESISYISLLIILTAVIETSLNTLFMYVLFSKATSLLSLITRILNQFLRIPITIVVFKMLVKRLDGLYFGNNEL